MMALGAATGSQPSLPGPHLGSGNLTKPAATPGLEGEKLNGSLQVILFTFLPINSK